MTVALADVAVLKQMLQPLPSFRNAEAICSYTQAFYTRRKVGGGWGLGAGRLGAGRLG